MKPLIIVMMFFILGALFIISNNNLGLAEKENISSFSKMYVGWIGNLYSNAQSVTGYVVKLDWLPKVEGENQNL